MTDEAFAQAAREYGDTVYRVACHALNSPHDAEDVKIGRASCRERV